MRVVAAGLALPVLVMLLAATPSVSPFADSLHPLLRYERSAVLNGEWWRLLTAHWVHLGPAHLAMNALALLLVLAVCRPVMSVPRALAWLLLYAPLVSACLLLFNPDIDWYLGLSGILHGLLVTGSILLLRSQPEAALLLIGLLVKLAAEQSGSWIFAGGGWMDAPAIVDAHLYGALAGLSGALVHETRRALQRSFLRAAMFHT